MRSLLTGPVGQRIGAYFFTVPHSHPFPSSLCTRLQFYTRPLQIAKIPEVRDSHWLLWNARCTESCSTSTTRFLPVYLFYKDHLSGVVISLVERITKNVWGNSSLSLRRLLRRAHINLKLRNGQNLVLWCLERQKIMSVYQRFNDTKKVHFIYENWFYFVVLGGEPTVLHIPGMPVFCKK